MTATAEKLYAARAGLYDRMISLIGHERSLEDFFRANIAFNDGMSVLDAGCGSGAATAAVLHAAGPAGPSMRVRAFDLTPAMLNRYHHRFPSVEARAADALHLQRDLPADWRGFDAIVTSGMLEYLPKDHLADALSALRRRAAPGGRLALFITRATPFTRWFIGRLWRAHVYGREEIMAALAAAGWDVASIAPFRAWGWAVIAKA